MDNVARAGSAQAPQRESVDEVAETHNQGVSHSETEQGRGNACRNAPELPALTLTGDAFAILGHFTRSRETAKEQNLRVFA